MRLQLFGLVLAAAAAGPAMAGGNCMNDVETAFNKQRQSKAYRVVITLPAEPGGPVDKFDYMPPLLVHRTLEFPTAHRSVETIGFGNRAWSKEDQGWMEMQPQFASMSRAHLKEMFGQPVKISTKYNCLGEVTFEGKDYKAYRTDPEKTDTGATVARSIYVDPETGLPAFNIIAEVDSEKPDLIREAYTYPDDIQIVIPEGAPVMKDKR